MKSGLVRRILSVILAVMLFVGNVMPVMAEGNAGVSDNAVEIDDTLESTEKTDSNNTEKAAEEEEQETVSENIVSENDADVSENTTVPEADEEIPEDEETQPEESADTEEISSNEIIDEEVPLSPKIKAVLAPVQDAQGEVEVTINHYYKDGSRLFVSQTKTVERGGKISKFIKGEDDFSVTQIKIADSVIKPENEDTFEYTVDTDEDTLVIDVYYTAAVTNQITTVPFTLIDYDDTVEYGNQRGSVYNPESINYYKNYESYEPLTFEEARQIATEDGWGQWFTQSDFDRLYDEYDARKDKKNWNSRFATKGAYMNYVVNEKNVDGQTVNANDYNTNKPRQVIEGLLLNLTGENYQEVNFKYEDPGFFTNAENQYGTKRIYDDYMMGFVRDGIGYTLQDIRKGSVDNVVWTDLNRFFPLSSKYGAINEYFGMRYDFTFKIGDYVGDMTYTFSGDDDLWVCIDGEVILDLGGIHQRVQGSVNVWEVLMDKENPSYEDKAQYLFGANGDDATNANAVHTITVIYMERGGSDSNCEMQFVMPNIIPSDPVTTTAPRAGVELVKKDVETNEVIEGVGFTLYSDYACQNPKGHEQLTDADGKVSFKDLRVGTYYLKETFYDVEKYKENETVYIVDVNLTNDGAEATIENLATKEGNAYVVYNTPLAKADIEFVKVDERDSSVVLEGAVFELTSATDETFVQTAVSDENGIILFENIAKGVYTLRETKAPDGYILPDNETLTVTVDGSAGNLDYTVSGSNENILLLYEKDDERHLVKNSKLVTVTIKKEWQDKDGKPLADEEAKEAVTVELFRMADGKEATKESVRKYLLSKDNDWTVKAEELERRGKNGEWTYFIRETEIEGFEAVYSEETKETAPDEIILVVTNKEQVGSLKITKTVNCVDSEHGVAAFMYKITYQKAGKTHTLYRTVSFEGDIDNEASKSVVIANLPVGEYTVEELSALRYECKTDVIQTKNVEADRTTEFAFRNEKAFGGNYSHTDVVVNKVTFNKDENGNITSAIINNQKKDAEGKTVYEKESTSDAVKE